MNYRTFLFILFIGFVPFSLSAQDSTITSGKISHKTAQHIYVRFEKKTDIKKGDTLYIRQANQYLPALIIEQISSLSSLCKSIYPSNLAAGIEVFVVNKQKIIRPEINDDFTADKISQPIDSVVQKLPGLPENEKSKRKELINGRFSFSTNGDMQDLNNAGFNRIRLSNSLNITNINNSAFSLQSYLTYRHRYGVDLENSNFFDDFKIFTLAIGYEPNSKHALWLGRRIHPGISSMGASDGIQYENKWKNLSTGLVAGFRPDVFNYGFNADLWQGGIFINWTPQLKKGTIQTSLALMDQHAGNFIDRRFLYFQHSNAVWNNTYLFLSSEIDLFRQTDSTGRKQSPLTSILASVRYRFSKKLSATLSYDSRQNIIYYQTYKFLLDQYLDQETRQGYRLQVNYNPIKLFSINASAFYRFQGNGKSPGSNYMINMSFPNIPQIKVLANISFNYLQTTLVNGQIFTGRISRDLFKGKCNMELNARYSTYAYNNNESVSEQWIAGSVLLYNVTKLSSISLNMEASIPDTKTYSRYFINFQQRFKSKIKKNAK